MRPSHDLKEGKKKQMDTCTYAPETAAIQKNFFKRERDQAWALHMLSGETRRRMIRMPVFKYTTNT